MAKKSMGDATTFLQAIQPPVSSLNVLFPDYTLSKDYQPDEELIQSLSECYTPLAVRLRASFLQGISVNNKPSGKKSAKLATPASPSKIIADLYARAGQSYLDHLKNYSLNDLRQLNPLNNETDSLAKFHTFFKPQNEFPPAAWKSMTDLLAKIWAWANEWHLGHYCYVHFACLALIQGHWISIADDGLQRLAFGPPRLSSPGIRPQTQNVNFQCFRTDPDSGWRAASQVFFWPAVHAMEEVIVKPPKGFEPYQGYVARGIQVTLREADPALLAREAYVKYNVDKVKKLIKSTLLASLGKDLQDKIIEEIRGTARCHSIEAQKAYNNQGLTIPGQFHRQTDRDIQWTICRVLLRYQWKEIAPREKESTISTAVRRTALKLFLPKDAYSFKSQPRNCE